MTTAIGELVGQGSRSRVHAYGRGAVVKVPGPTTPDSWIAFEARYGDAARLAGAPVPALLGTERLGGRLVSVWERVHGPSLWTWATDRPGRLRQAGTLLADVQLGLFDLVPPLVLPRQHDRLVSKIRRAAALVDPAPTGAGLSDALPLVPPRTGPVRLCHGDLHPGNLVLSPGGVVVVDWFDAARGDAALDVARSLLVMLPDEGRPAPEQPTHLPGGGEGARDEVSRAYRERVTAGLAARGQVWEDEAWDRALAVGAAARIAEGVRPGALLSLWNDYSRRGPGPLAAAGSLVRC